MQTTINNSNATRISELINGIDFENFGKMDKLELISSFLLNPKFLNFVKAMATQKKCCQHYDCFFNINNSGSKNNKDAKNCNDQTNINEEKTSRNEKGSPKIIIRKQI